MTITQRRFSVSTWSLKRQLGLPAFYGVDNNDDIPTETHGTGKLSLLELPGHLANFGITTLEICHFHLPSLDQGYLSELRTELQKANVELFSLLIDSGDITYPVHAERDLAWIENWLTVASQLGSRCARVIAGRAIPTEESLERCTQGMQRLASKAEGLGLRLMTENWGGLLSTPAAIHTLFDRLDGRIGLCLDFGNWQGPTKYSDLRSIAPYAESCHAKAHFTKTNVLDRADFTACLDITRATNFIGPYTLIYDSADPDEWAGLAQEKAIVQEYL